MSMWVWVMCHVMGPLIVQVGKIFDFFLQRHLSGSIPFNQELERVVGELTEFQAETMRLLFKVMALVL